MNYNSLYFFFFFPFFLSLFLFTCCKQRIVCFASFISHLMQHVPRNFEFFHSLSQATIGSGNGISYSIYKCESMILFLSTKEKTTMNNYSPSESSSFLPSCLPPAVVGSAAGGGNWRQKSTIS